MPTTTKKQSTKKTTKKSTKKTTKKAVKTAVTKAATTKAATKQPAKPAKKAITLAAKPVAKKPAKKPAPKAAAKATGLIEVGSSAPAFSAVNAAGKTVTLASLKGKPFVLYFYPADDTPGCTVEACAFRDNRPKFAKVGCEILGVSPDSVDSHKAFDAKYKLGLTLLADVPGKDGVPPVAAAFGVWQEKNMYGKKYMGIVRTTYVVAKDGTVAARFDRVKVEGHAAEVLAAVAKLG
ncbi:MAG: peroxiredoxin [bacterium]